VQLKRGQATTSASIAMHAMLAAYIETTHPHPGRGGQDLSYLVQEPKQGLLGRLTVCQTKVLHNTASGDAAGIQDS